MSVTIHIPVMLRHECGGQSKLSVSATSIRHALEELAKGHPAVYRSVCNETGVVRRHVHLFINSSLVTDDGLDTKLKPNDELFIMPAVSGG